MPDDKEKKWGTIYLDAEREATISKLDAMQAASRQEQWNQRTQNDYLEKVRAKATERAREILGEAYTERQRVLEEAKEDARRIRLEAQVEYAKAEDTLAEAQKMREEAQAELDEATATHNASQEDGFNAGLHQAQQELEAFRAAMGSSVAGVLRAIEGQCMSIFEGWRGELTQLVKVCVEKATGIVLDEHYQLILEHLVLEAVRQLDDRRCITLRVHPDDESAVADMFAAAKEKMPNIGQWMVTGDPSLGLGGLIAESQSGTVDSRLELFQELVENILQHLTLPGTHLESVALAAVEEAVRQEAAQIAAIAPPMEEQQAPLDMLPAPAEESLASMEAEAVGHASPAPEASLNPELLLNEEAVAAALAAAEAQGFDNNDMVHPEGTAPAFSAAPPAAEMHAAPDAAMYAAPHAPQEDLPQEHEQEEAAQEEPLPPVEASPLAEAEPRQGKLKGHEPTREELEEELLPLPPEGHILEGQDLQMPNPSPLDVVLAGGGFLEPQGNDKGNS